MSHKFVLCKYILIVVYETYRVSHMDRHKSKRVVLLHQKLIIFTLKNKKNNDILYFGIWKYRPCTGFLIPLKIDYFFFPQNVHLFRAAKL